MKDIHKLEPNHFIELNLNDDTITLTKIEKEIKSCIEKTDVS